MLNILDRISSFDVFNEPMLKKGSFCTVLIVPATMNQTEWDHYEELFKETRRGLIISYSNKSQDVRDFICVSRNGNWTNERPSILLTMTSVNGKKSVID